MKQYEAVIETLRRLGGMCYIRPAESGGVQDRGLPMEYEDPICIHTSYCARPQGNLSHSSGIMGIGGI